MRGPHGLRLLDPAHIVFLRPEDLGGKEGQPLTTREQRLQYGVYLWQAVYQHAPNPPPLPTDEEFLREASRVQQQVARGLPLDHPMDVVYVTPNSFCNAQGEAFAPRKQRKLLRTALQVAKNEVKRQQHLPFERPLRRRRPLSARSQLPIVPMRGASETQGTFQ